MTANALAVAAPVLEQGAVKKKMKISRRQMLVRNVIKNRNKIRFDLAIQRNKVWKEAQKSKLIDSILRNFPIPQVFVISSDDGAMWMADGKQRWTTIMSFRDNGFALEKGSKPVLHENTDGAMVEYDVEGKYFKDLDKVLQDHFLDYEMDIREVQNATKEDIEELFVRLNNGTPLTKMELTRATAGEEIMSEINELSEHRFFSFMANISDTSRNRFVDQEVILQTLMLSMGRETGISAKEIADFTQAIRANGIPEDMMKIMRGGSEYLKDALEQFVKMKDGKPDKPVLNKMLKKIHIPMLFMTAVEAIQQEVEPDVFGQWAKSFLVDRYTPGGGQYGRYCVAGSAKKDSVQGRLRVMKADFLAKIDLVTKEWEDNAALREHQRKMEEEAARKEAGEDVDVDSGEETTEDKEVSDVTEAIEDNVTTATSESTPEDVIEPATSELDETQPSNDGDDQAKE